MARQPEDWLDETPSPQEDDDEIIWVSKSEIKRDAEALKKLGAELVDLSKNELERIPSMKTYWPLSSWHKKLDAKAVVVSCS